MSIARLAPRAAILATVVALALVMSPGAGSAAGQTAPPGGSWTVYHGDPLGSGLAATEGSLAHLHRRWSSPVLDGELYGEPLVSGDLVVVATENDVVYGLSLSTGRVRWSTHVGSPVPSSALPCGDISPSVGITSTPVIDRARNEVFAVADREVNGMIHHQLIGISLASGRIELRQDVDPPGVYTPAILQRVALTLDQGRVVFGYGGNDGDCSSYHGWVVSAPETGGPLRFFEIDQPAGDSQGAVWMGGAAPVVDAAGHLWIAAGNGSVGTQGAAYDGSDSVVELSTQLRRLQFFAPSDWTHDNADDRDLGSSAPVLFANGAVLQAGKSQTVFLLSASRLGGIGGQLSEAMNICGGNVDGGSAVVGTTAYLPCLQGIVAVSVSLSPARIHVLWQSSTGSGGPPIVADGLVWTISQSGVLFALNPKTGDPVETLPIGSVANHFPTPTAVRGLVLAPNADQVVAFGR